MIRVTERTNNMRKPEKFVYRDYLNKSYMRMLRLCIKANRAHGNVRREYQSELDVEFDIIRSLVDVAASPEEKLISPGLHEVWSKELKEIGRMIGGWIKSDASR